ncbi:hypothetical protein MMC13_007431 [Lambiella insularis]|nr:hypothetical protein [Lambiella insularis]
MSAVTSTSTGTAASNTPNAPLASSSKLGWTAGVGFGIGFFVLVTLIVALTWWLLRRRRRLRKSQAGSGSKDFDREGHATGIREHVNGKAQLEDTQVLSLVHEIPDWGEAQLEDTQVLSPVHEIPDWGEAQLEDTQVLSPLHEIPDWGEKQVEPVLELDGLQAPVQELTAGPLSNRHEVDGNEVVSPLNTEHEKLEDIKISPVLADR